MQKKTLYAVRSNVAVRGDSSPCSRGLWSNHNLYHKFLNSEPRDGDKYYTIPPVFPSFIFAA